MSPATPEKKGGAAVATSTDKAPKGVGDHTHDVVATFQPKIPLQVTESELTDLRALGVIKTIDGVSPEAFDKKVVAEEKKAAADDTKKES